MSAQTRLQEAQTRLQVILDNPPQSPTMDDHVELEAVKRIIFDLTGEEAYLSPQDRTKCSHLFVLAIGETNRQGIFYEQNGWRWADQEAA